MKAHKIMEFAPKLGVGQEFTKNMLPRAHKYRFEFSGNNEFQIPMKYGYEIFNAGALRLPFNEIYFEVPATAIDGGQPGDFGALACHVASSNTVIGRLYFLQGDNVATMPLSIVLDLESATQSCQPDPDAAEVIRGLGLGVVGPAELQTWQASAMNSFTRTLLGCVGVLATRGIIEREIDAPHRLNKRRQALGKGPVFSYQTVTVDPRLVPGARLGAGTGTRSPPRLHWRQGHYRTLASGRQVHVRPSLIGLGELGFVAKDYFVPPP